MRRLVAVSALVCSAFCVNAAPVTVAFDDRPSSFGFDANGQLDCVGNFLTNQYAALGVTFGSLCVADANADLDATQTPARSQNNVVASLTGTATFNFLSPVLSVLLYTNHFEDITVSAFDSSNNLLSFIQGIGDNTSLVSDQNEALEIDNPLIRRITVTSNSPFTFDDLTFEVSQGGPAPVPEPASGLLAMAGISAIIYLKRR